MNCKLAKIVWAMCVFQIAAMGSGNCADLAPFLQAHCTDCHDSTTRKGGLDLESLKFNPDDRSQFETWVRVHDRIQNGEMPPKKSDRPPEVDRTSILTVLDDKLHDADARYLAKRGRALYRRLNAQEVENALKDLLELPDLRIKEILPEDERRHGFNKISEALDLSNVHLAKYMDAVDMALSAAIATRLKPPPIYRKRFYPAAGTETWIEIIRANAVLLTNKHFDPLCPLPDPTKRIQDNNPIDLAYQMERSKLVQSLKLCDFKGSLGFFSGTYDRDWRTTLQFAPVHPGYYRIRTSTWSFWWDKGTVAPSPRQESFMLSVWLPEPGNRYAHSASRRLGMFDASSLESRVHELTAWIEPDEELLFEIGTLTGFAKNTGREPSAEPGSATTYTGPGMAIDWLEVEGPIFEQWPPKSHRVLFGDLPFKPFDPSTKQRPPERKVVKQIANFGRPNNSELTKEDTEPPLVTVATDHPEEDAVRLLETFLPKAFRCQVTPEEVSQYASIAKRRLEAKDTFEDAMREAYKAALYSTDFLFTSADESDGSPSKPTHLSDHALAERLSLWFWNSRPDNELNSLAEKGTLHLPKTLDEQVERLLKDPKSERFIADFLDQWLDLRKLDASSPDRRTYPEFRSPVRESMPAESRAFFRELITKNLGITNLIASDFVMINQSLAELYGIPGVTGCDIRRVTVPPNSKRGGVITQAGVLKVTANGTTTSPVIRGVWFNERILGNPIPPPPPGVPSIEPDTRGATTIREQLDKHRADAKCAACHAKIDPIGFALESFDVIGGFRERYRSLERGDANTATFAAGWKPGYRFAKPVDSAGQLQTGESFKDIAELRSILIKNPKSLAFNLTRQFLMYATGAESYYSDRREISRIVERAKSDNYGLRSLIHAIVQSDLFLRK